MARAAAQRRDRRGDITRALYRCISSQGYANTTLKDIADCAGMSPSHVGYYFENKRAILAYYGAAICDLHIASLPQAGESDPSREVDALAEFCLGEGQMNTALVGVIQELNGLAVHDAGLHQIKSNHEIAFREYFERFFERVPPANGASPREAAFLAHATLIGLTSNTLFDSELDREVAHRLLRRALRALVGLEDTGRAAARPASRTRRAEPPKRAQTRRRR